MRFNLMETICRTGIFVICAQVLIHLRPDRSYEKYLKMWVSAIILLQLFTAAGSFFTGEGEGGLAAQVSLFREQLEQGMLKVAESQAQRNAVLDGMTLEEVQRLAAAGAVGENGESGENGENSALGRTDPGGESGTVGENGEAKTDGRVKESDPSGGIAIHTQIDPIDRIELGGGGKNDD